MLLSSSAECGGGATTPHMRLLCSGGMCHFTSPHVKTCFLVVFKWGSRILRLLPQLGYFTDIFKICPDMIFFFFF